MSPPGFMALVNLLSNLPERPEIISKAVRNTQSDYLSLRRLVSVGLVDKIDAPRDRYDNLADGRTEYLYKISERGKELREMYLVLARELNVDD